MSVETPQKQLNVQLSNFEKPLTFNEWSEKFQVSSRYIEPTKYFKGNPSCGVPDSTEVTRGFWLTLRDLFFN
jgi:hypothetical protein